MDLYHNKKYRDRFFQNAKQSFTTKTEIPSNDKADDNLLRGELLDELAAALEKLDERERDIIILHTFYDVDHRNQNSGETKIRRRP